MRLLRASLLKLVRRPATRRAPLVLAALIALIYLSIGMSAGTTQEARAGVEPMLAFPGAYTVLASMLLMFSGIVGAAYAGAVVASEWSWSTFRTALARGESRVGYVTGLFVAIALLTLVAWLAVYGLGVGVILVASSLGGVPAGDPFSLANLAALPVLIASGGWAVLMLVGLGFGVSFVSRSAVAGVATVMGLVFIEQFAAMTSIPVELLRLAPMTAASSLVSAAGNSGLDAAIVLPLVVTTIYLVLSIGIAAAVGRRAQVA
ncbi:MAG TPA: hypothetical protein VJ506_08500 [Candidatus Limnocylindrales bacterium]|nr:hypothetical protein [Candidatus Limnocylindrales bacterium]